MLTLEPPVFTIRGLTIFRDFNDRSQFYYLPRDRARVTENGKGLDFVVYTDDITGEPDFSLSEDHAGGFLTLEVELGPDESELEQVRSALESQAGVGQVKLAQVPFTNGSVSLFVLGPSAAAGTDLPKGLEVLTAGATKPSLFGRQTAAFSVRLGGKAANILYETLRKSSDPQAVVTYDLEFLALRPAYNLEIKIDFKETFTYLRNRIGLNLLVAAADMDFLTQEMVNQGTITIHEVDYTGKANTTSPLAAEGGILKLVRDLMSPTLFTTLPIPTPEYRALPDSASQALTTPGGTNQVLSVGGNSAERSAITVGTDLKLTHTPPAGGQAAGAAMDLAVTVLAASGITVSQITVQYRVKGATKAYQELVLRVDGATPTTPTPGPGPTPGVTPPTPGVTPPTPGVTPPTPGVTPPTPGVTPPTPGVTPPGLGPTPAPSPAHSLEARDTESDTPAPVGAPGAPGTPGAPGAPAASGGSGTYTGRVPGQPSGTTVEYFIRASGTKSGTAIVQTLPEQQPDVNPLAYTVGTSQRPGVDLKVPQTDGPLIGYSLRSIDITQQVTRTFTLSRTEAVTQRYHPSGALSRDGIGSEFNPDQQVTRVALGEGPFKVIVIRADAGFDFETQHVRMATVHITYGRNPNGTGPLHAVNIALDKEHPSGKVQFFADETSTQEYDYFVEFTYDPDRVIGTTPGTAVRSRSFMRETTRIITVDLDRHSPLIPVRVEAGFLKFNEGIIQQVQVRVAPISTGEGRTMILDQNRNGDVVQIVPANPAVRQYYMRQEFKFKNHTTILERHDVSDTQVVVNEPSDLIFRMVPQLNDPWNLVKEVLFDAHYVHADNTREVATLHLDSNSPKSEFAVVLRPGDQRSWEARPRFVMKAGEPIEARKQQFVDITEPLIGLTQAGLRVALVELLDESIFTGDLLGIKMTFGQDVEDPSLPSVTMLLKAGRTSGAVVVPGVAAGSAVSVAMEVLRRGLPPQRSLASLRPAETTLYVNL